MVSLITAKELKKKKVILGDTQKNIKTLQSENRTCTNVRVC